MTNIFLKSDLALLSLESFDIRTLVIESRVLRSNPVGDSNVKRSPVLVPKGDRPSSGWPVVLMLSGFTGNGTHVFNHKTFEESQPQILDRLVSRGEAPRAIYVFCDAMTSWGGSQFIDSRGQGRFETYIATELVRGVLDSLPASREPQDWCVMGGSSGGYGALHLASRHPEIFGVVVAIAPDCFFEASLLSEIRTALPLIEKIGGVQAVRDELVNGKLSRRKEWHTILNAIAMGLCYADDGAGGVEWPIDAKTGVVVEHIWKRWLAHDPIVFLPERVESIRKWNGCLLDVGTRDQFQLQYGTRQLSSFLSEVLAARLSFTEFDGTHFDIGDRRPMAWKWLMGIWG